MTTTTPEPKTATDAPFRVENAVCARCKGPLFFSRKTWMFCPKCEAMRAVMALQATLPTPK